jgi:hypothetical protein
MNPPHRPRRFLDWHERPGLVAWTTTPLGRLALWTAAALLLPARYRLLVLPLLALALVLPARRIDLLALGALLTAYKFLPKPARAGHLTELAGILLTLAVVALVFLAARGFKDLPRWVQRHPFLILHGALYGSVVVAFVLPLPRGSFLAALAATCRSVVPFLVWRCSYVMLAGKRGSAATSRFRDHLSYCLPIWGGTLTPLGKGHDYLQQTRADAPDQIAAAQLSGLKLIGLAWIWTGARDVLYALVNGLGPLKAAAWLGGRSLGMPTLEGAIASAGTRHWPAATLWACLGIELVAATLELAIHTHFAIGILRLFGFRVFRNTYKPLLAGTLVDFWNRYYYYFKELLVEFFFFPTYLRVFKGRPRLRIFAATMAAAGVGNLYYHVMRDSRELFLMPRGEAASRVASRALYSLVLSLGIFVSMLRERERRGKPLPAEDRWAPFRRLRAIAGVWLFFGLLHVWSIEPVMFGFGKRARFFCSLFGL